MLHRSVFSQNKLIGLGILELDHPASYGLMVPETCFCAITQCNFD
jgi:hypothetical protein